MNAITWLLTAAVALSLAPNADARARKTRRVAPQGIVIQDSGCQRGVRGGISTYSGPTYQRYYTAEYTVLPSGELPMGPSATRQDIIDGLQWRRPAWGYDQFYGFGPGGRYYSGPYSPPPYYNYSESGADVWGGY